MRRENEQGLIKYTGRTGLPLHAQGKLENKHIAKIGCRITPACAGKTLNKLQKIKVLFYLLLNFHLVYLIYHKQYNNPVQPYAFHLYQ